MGSGNSEQYAKNRPGRGNINRRTLIVRTLIVRTLIVRTLIEGWNSRD